ncbi:hypothetical protein BBP00_00001978 [Phytophthora kernoviae]|uniref:Uncharacterized protein n=1 Tax=Phytophthora kernoviae TaxID=325452 RepID=A0A3F2S040_9STRA|nr:hypothetical protein BBP00_00001978 [Phytophthora kernoviae]
MGDAAGNGGMKRIQKAISDHLGVYVASVQLGNSVAEDAEDSFFVKMNEQTEMFAKIVREDPHLKGGFNAAGFSQGNLLIRAYIERFNDPPVHTFISMHGPLAGVSGLPKCSITNFICKEIDKLIGEAVYTNRVQDRIAQANYFRDPLRIEAYLKHVDFLPDINNEKTSTNQTYKDNFTQLQNLVLVRAEQDTQVYPKESEWFGAYQDGDSYKKVLGFNETKWYKEDLFGLRTLNEAGKVHFLSTDGDHLQFSTEFLLGVMDNSQAFGELLTAEETTEGTTQSLPAPTTKICPTPRLIEQDLAQNKCTSTRAGVCPSPRVRNVVLDDEAWPLSASKGPTSPFTPKNYDITTLQRQPGTDQGAVMFTPPTPNKRVCSHQGFTQSKAGATAASGSWAPSLTQARKRSLGVSDAVHFASASPSDKRASLSIDMNLESRSNSVFGALPSLSSAPPVASATRGSASSSVPKKGYAPQQRRSRNPGNLSLDLSQVDQANFDPCNTAAVSKRQNDQAGVCSKLTEFLFIGGAAAAKNKTMLSQEGITHVINCAASVAPASFPDEFRYLNIKLRDHSSQDIARHFYTMFDFIERARERGGRVFLHCVKGISRSPTMAIAYLMWYKHIGMYKALDFVRQARPVVDPNAGFIFQLTEWEQRRPEGKIKFQSTIVFRVEVPPDNSDKGNNCNNEVVPSKKPLVIGPISGVSEGYFRDPAKDIGELSFIVACTDYMFVWSGTDVSQVQLEGAQGGAEMLQRFEAFPAKCDAVRQGQEPVAFWDLVADEI